MLLTRPVSGFNVSNCVSHEYNSSITASLKFELIITSKKKTKFLLSDILGYNSLAEDTRWHKSMLTLGQQHFLKSVLFKLDPLGFNLTTIIICICTKPMRCGDLCLCKSVDYMSLDDRVRG